jgi:hypothetical protein
MRNDTGNWTAIPALDVPQGTADFTFQAATLLRQTMVSGTSVLRNFSKACGPAMGWPDIALGGGYCIALRRDRVLLVNGPELADGWHAEAGHAVSDMTGGYAVFEIWGERAIEGLKRGADLNPAIPSRSALRRFGGLDVILYRFEEQSRFRLHCDRAQRDAVRLTLQSCLEGMC